MKQGWGVFLLLCGLGSAFPSYAYYALPVRQEIELGAGEAGEIEYTLVNDGEDARTIDVSAVEWRHYSWNQGIRLDDWLNFTPKQARLEPGEQKKIKARVRVPGKAKGELIAMIYFCDNSPEQQYKVKFGVSAYVAVKRTVHRDFEITNAVIRQSEDSTGGNSKVEVAATVMNRGNVHLRPSLEADLVLPDGVLKVPLKYGDPVFPGESYIYNGDAPWTRRLPDGEYPATLTLREAGQELGAGLTGVLKVEKGKWQFIKP